MNKEYADSLRLIADWYEAHPDISGTPGEEISVYSLDSKEDAALVLRAFGGCEKEFQDDLFFIKKTFGGISLRFVFYRQSVCERRVVSTEEVPERVIPEQVIKAHTKETVEWDCHPILSTAQQKRQA